LPIGPFRFAPKSGHSAGGRVALARKSTEIVGQKVEPKKGTIGTDEPLPNEDDHRANFGRDPMSSQKPAGNLHGKKTEPSSEFRGINVRLE
jgi:hypothetical protein